MIKILIADDHAIVREGLKQIVLETPDMVISREAVDGRSTLEHVRETEFDVIVLDLSMPGMSGLDILKQLKIENPKLPVLILSMHPEEQYAVRCFKSGASGYVTKQSAPDELISAIRKVVQGGKYISLALAEKLVDFLEAGTDKLPHETLSDREFQIMRRISAGKRLKEIAEELFLSDKTVSTYRSRILDKMGMKSNSELTQYAVSNGLLS